MPIPLIGAISLNDSNQQRRRIGLNTLIKITNKTAIYGQYLFSQNGIQAGIKAYDFIFKGIGVRAEYNKSDKPEISDSLIDFTHFNEFLGHPSGSENFEEFLGVVNFQCKRFIADVTISAIFPAKLKRRTVNANLGYIINPSANTQLTFGYLNRARNDGYSSGLVSIGIKSNVFDAFYNY